MGSARTGVPVIGVALSRVCGVSVRAYAAFPADAVAPLSRPNTSK